MGTRSLQASSKGIEKAKIALAQYSLSQNALAEALGLSRQTVNSFFKGRPIDRENFALICERLGLDLENTVAISGSKTQTSKLVDSSEVDALVQDVRQKVYTNIQERCSTMRVLDMTRPIDLDAIYTDVNILQEITGRRRLALAELLEHCSLEEFDRLGFAQALTERRSGLEAVEEFDKLMLLGKPGAGKTTFLKRLATLCNTGNFQNHRVPIFITLKDFGDSSENPSLLTYINQWLKEQGIQDSQSTEQILNQGRGLLLLDGLDEVSERSSKHVLQEIQSFSDRFPQNAFVVSCRIAAKEFTFQQFTEVEVADFSDKQIADFAGRWFQAKQLAEKTKHFLAKLEEQPRIKELATNPLLLTLLCLVFEGRTDFPANRSELYEEGLDVLLKKWDGTRSIEREQVYRELSLKRKEDLLSRLAFVTFEPGNYFFKQKEAELLIETYIQNLPGAQSDPEVLRLDSEAVLKSIEAQHGLLVERARSIYSFSHLTFHEYFTARRIEKRHDLRPVLISHLTKKRWREVFLLTVEMLEEEDSNSLLLTMKSEIDGMLATDDRLQHFLRWVEQKSTSVQAPYKPAAVRAFYFLYDRLRDLLRDPDPNSPISLNPDPTSPFNLDSDIDPDIDVTLALVSDPKHRNILALAISFDINLPSFLEISLDTALDHVLIAAFNNARALVRASHASPDHFIEVEIDSEVANLFDLDLDSDSDPNIEHVIPRGFAKFLKQDLTLASGLTYNSKLRRELQQLKGELPSVPSTSEWKSCNQWWEDNGQAWVNKFQAVITQHRNIGHDWQFSDAQKTLLQQYYDANQLLIDCLNSDCYVSREVREEIEGSLLLPAPRQD